MNRHNARGINTLDILRVGDFDELPIGVDDPAILRWCEENGRILVTFDRNSMPNHLQEHLASARHSPGVFMLNSTSVLKDILDYLIVAAYGSDPDEWRDWINYV